MQKIHIEFTLLSFFPLQHTQAQAKKLGVSGWVQNTPSGTVVGCVEGSEDKVIMM